MTLVRFELRGRTINASQNTLLGFAVLRANFNAGTGDYLDGFHPFLLSVLAESSKPFIERAEIADIIHDMFGISIPSLVIKNIIRTLKKRDLTESVGTTAVKITAKGLEQAPALQQQITQYNQRQKELALAFEQFATDTFPGQIDFSQAPAATTLANYFERHAAPLLNQALRGKGPADPAPGTDFIVSSFVTKLAETDQTRFGYVVEAAKGAMLSTVLLLDTSGLKNSLTDLNLVLDTPVLMDALGFHGDQPQIATRQLIAMAHAQSAKVVTFDHSVDELDGVLEHIVQALRKGGQSRSVSPGYLHFAENGASPADVALLQSKVAELLTDAQITVIGRPDGYYEYGLDEAKLEDLIKTKIHYYLDSARVNDVVSLSSTHRLRKGRRMRSLEECKAVLVTTNKSLVMGAIEFEDRGGSFPLAVTTDAVASVLWVRSPTAAPDAPREILLAAAYAGMQPNPAVWTKYLEEIDTLESADSVTADEAVILRTSRISRQSLMNETLGQSEAVSAESPLAALERIRTEVSEPLQEQVRTLEEQARRADEIANAASETWIEHLDARRAAEAEAERAIQSEKQTQAELHALRQSEEDKLANVSKRAALVAHRWRTLIAWVVRCAAIAALAWALVLFLFLPDPGDRTGVIIVGVAGFIGILLTVLPPLDRVLEPLERRLAKAGERRRLLNMGISPDVVRSRVQ